MEILIIDDDEEFCEELAQLIKEEGGFKVDIATDGTLGHNLIEKGNYQVILLDLKLPGLNGYELLKKIRENKKPVKVMVLSGRPSEKSFIEDKPSKKEEDRILRMADAVMSKPFKVDEFIKKIQELVKK